MPKSGMSYKIESLGTFGPIVKPNTWYNLQHYSDLCATLKHEG